MDILRIVVRQWAYAAMAADVFASNDGQLVWHQSLPLLLILHIGYHDNIRDYTGCPDENADSLSC